MTKKKVIKNQEKEASLTLVRNGSPIKKEQLLMVLQKTPKEHIYTRPGKRRRNMGICNRNIC